MSSDLAIRLLTNATLYNTLFNTAKSVVTAAAIAILTVLLCAPSLADVSGGSPPLDLATTPPLRRPPSRGADVPTSQSPALVSSVIFSTWLLEIILSSLRPSSLDVLVLRRSCAWVASFGHAGTASGFLSSFKRGESLLETSNRLGFKLRQAMRAMYSSRSRRRQGIVPMTVLLQCCS